MPGKLTRGYRDYGREYSSASFFIADFEEETFAETLTALDVFTAALDAITLGNPAKETIKIVDETISEAPAGSAFAQRETKWFCRYTDNTTGDQHTLEIPTADLSLLVANTEFMNLASGAGATFKAQFELNVVSELGNPVTLNEVEYVARDL